MDKKIRLFVDCHVFDGVPQGTKTYLHGIYSELIKDRSIHFYLAATDIYNLEKIFGSHINVTYIKYKSHSSIYRLLIDIPFLIKKHKIEFAHFQYRVPPIKFCRYIVTVHDVLFEDFPQYFPIISRRISYLTYLFSARYSDIVLTVSNYSKQKIKQHLGVANAIITPNGVDKVFFDDYDKELVQQQVFKKFKASNYIIYTSRWEPRKNQLLLLQQFVDLELYKHYQLVFVGSSTFNYPQYDNYYAGLDSAVKKKVLHLSGVKFKDMLLLLRGAVLSVYPSIAEGFGIPPLESVAAGIPTLTSNTTAMAEFIFMGQNLFDPYSPQQLAEKIKRSLAHSDEEQLLRLKKHVQEHYNWSISAEVFKAALKSYY